MAKAEYDLCVIGGGAGGLVVAAGGAALGARVILIEKNRLGGDCLYYGCVPSKTLLHSARVAALMRRANTFGLPAVSPQVDLARIMERVRSVIEAIEPNDSPERFRALGVEVVFGAGRFTDHATFTVAGRHVSARRFVVATGSAPAMPPIPGIERVPYLTNETVFDLSEPVPHLLVLGAGPIGLELAQAFVRLGSEVSVVEQAAQALPREDADLAAELGERLRADGIQLLLGHRVERLDGHAGEIELRAQQEGRQRLLRGSHLLVATGRRANVEHLGLDSAGVALVKGRVHTDKRMRTTNKRIFACGDVTSGHPFTHMAEHQAGVVLRNALLHLPASVEERAIPWCTFTDPELARVGLSENEAVASGRAHRVYRFPFADIDRAQAEGETAGFAKIITDPRGRLLGAAILGPQAGELISEYALALAKKLKASDLSGVIHVYPTLAQINRRVADQVLKAQLTPARKKWLKRLFRLRGS